MGAVLGALTSLCIGLSDLFIMRIAPRHHIVTVTFVVVATALGFGVLGLFVIDSAFVARDIGYGMAGGVGMMVGIIFYFRAMLVASAGIVTPLIAVQTALWPLGYDVVVHDTRPTALVWIGVGVAVLSLLLTTISPELVGRIAAGVRLAVISGTGFGLGVLCSGLGSEDSGMWVLVANRGTSLVLVVVLAVILDLPKGPGRADLPSALVGGAFAGLALGTYVYATQRHDLAVVGVTGSLFPAVTAFLLWRFLHQPLRWWQAVGIAGALTGTALIAVG